MIRVIGLGNLLRGDDGIGPRILDELKKSEYIQDAELIDAAADAFIVLEYLKDPEHPVVIIDCARMGLDPGSVHKFSATETNLSRMNQLISLHGFSLGDIYKMAEVLGPVAPCTIIGIEPRSLDFNTGLSREVEQSIPKIINLVIEEIKKDVKKDFNH